MGRTEKSQGLAPPAIRKDIRAKQARHIINKVVPAILASNARAKRGTENSELIADPSPGLSSTLHTKDAGGEDVAHVKRKGQGRRKAKGGQEWDENQQFSAKGKWKKSGKRRNDSIDEDLSSLALNERAPAPATPTRERTVRIVTTDSLTAAQLLATNRLKQTKSPKNVCILNMASPLRPGGGVLAGATSQEEFLCARTTLLPSLKEEFYRLPEFGAIYTPDVLVFRSSSPLGDNVGELAASERYWVDVVSAGMLRFPDLEGEEDEVKRLSKKDRDIVERKMRAVLRIAMAKGVKKLVLGAWGCGAYGNPVQDIAEAWYRVLHGSSDQGAKKGKVAPDEVWPALEEVTFAIANVRMAREFARAFGSGSIEVEQGPRRLGEDDEDDEDFDKTAQELRSKIEEMEGQINNVWNADLKARLQTILSGLKAQLEEREGGKHRDEESDSDGDSTDVSRGGCNSERMADLAHDTLDESDMEDHMDESEPDSIADCIAVRV